MARSLRAFLSQTPFFQFLLKPAQFNPKRSSIELLKSTKPKPYFKLAMAEFLKVPRPFRLSHFSHDNYTSLVYYSTAVIWLYDNYSYSLRLYKPESGNLILTPIFDLSITFNG